MATAKNMKELEKIINEKIQNSLNTDVAKKVIKVAQEHVQKDVYNVYDPKVYERTGKLKDSFVVNDFNGGIEIENIREDDDRYIPEIIEYGHDKSEQGYTYAYYYPDGDNYIQPRPFIQNTKEQIINENIHINELKKSLKKQGLDVK